MLLNTKTTLALGIVLSLLFVSVVSAASLDGIYYTLCREASCEVYAGQFQLSDSPIYLRAYNIDGVTLKGEIKESSGAINSLNFKNGIAKISFSRTGIYTVNVVASKEGYDNFEKTFSFTVVDKIAPIKDISIAAFCARTLPEKKRTTNFAYFGLDSDNESIRQEIITSLNKKPELEIAGTSWLCPPPGAPRPGICKVQSSESKLTSYYPKSTSVSLCGKEVNGTINIHGSRIVLGSDTSVLNDALIEANTELKNINSEFVCEEGCTKKMSIGVKKSQNILGGLLGTAFTFNYKVECLSIKNPDGWQIEGDLYSEKRCVVNEKFILK